MQNTILKVSASIAVIIAISIASFLTGEWFVTFGGGHIDLNRPEHWVKLRRIIYSLQPGVDEARRLATLTGQCPTEADFKASKNLPSAYITTCFSDGDGHYIPEAGENFRLYYKLNWDAALFYDSSDATWEYVPGDGRPATIITP